MESALVKIESEYITGQQNLIPYLEICFLNMYNENSQIQTL